MLNHPDAGRRADVEKLAGVSRKGADLLQALIETVISFFGLTFFVLIIWRLLVYGHSLQIGGEVSATIRIPLYPFAYGIAVASVPVALVFLAQILKAIVRMVTK